MASLSTHDITIEDRSAGTPKLGLMLAKRNGRRNFTIADYRTLVPRVLSDAEITQAFLPPEVESIWYQSDWRDGMGGVDSTDSLRIAEGYRIDTSIKGRMQLARLFKVSTVDTNPNEYKPSGFSVDPGNAAVLWGFIGETDSGAVEMLYQWDYTNKNWDRSAFGGAVTGIRRNGVPYGTRAYIPVWTSSTDAPIAYDHVTNGALTEMGAGAGYLYPKYFAPANGSLWMGYVVDASGTDKNEIRSATDPTAYANWGSAIFIGTADSEITALVGSSRTLYVCKTNGLWAYYPAATTPYSENLTPEFEQMSHPDNFRAAIAWNDAVILAPGTGGLRSWYSSTLYDISPSLAMPEQTQFHGRVCALAGDPTALFALVLDTTNLKYHVLMMVYQEMADGSNGYAWHHIGSITYVTSTVANHATMYVESTVSGSNTHHRLWVGVESGGSNLLPYFYTISTNDIEHVFNAADDGYAITVKDDHNFPQVSKRYSSVTFETANLGSGANDHYIEAQYRVDGGAWTYITGTQATSKLTTSPQTLTFAAETTGKFIEFKFLFYQGTTTTTTPHLKSFRLTFQIRTTAIKSLPLVVELADGQRLKNGLPSYSSGSDLTQLESWDAQAGEVTVKVPKGVVGTGTSYNMVFVPGSLRVNEVANPHRKRPAYEASFTLVEV